MTFHLETFGGLRLVAADGQAVNTQRRRLALLALLAAAGEHGLTRMEVACEPTDFHGDRIAVCSGPESDRRNGSDLGEYGHPYLRTCE